MSNATDPAQFQPQNSISRLLLTSVLAVYFLLTLMITAIQIGLEYNNTRNSLLNDIRHQHHTFAASFARAMWEFNTPQAESLAMGMTNIPSISGIILRDDQGNVIYSSGRVVSEERLKQMSALGGVIENQGVFGYFSPLVWEFAGGSQMVGDVTLFSSREITIERLKPSLMVLVFAAVIKSSLLIILFTLAFRLFLKRPFAQLIEQIRQFNPDDPEGSQIHLPKGQANEFTLLEITYNRLLQRLRLHQEEREVTQREMSDLNRQLDEQNSQLEREITEKTLRISQVMLNLEQRRVALQSRQDALEEEIRQCRLAASELKQRNLELEQALQFSQNNTKRTRNPD